MDNKKLMLNYVFCCSFFFFKNLKKNNHQENLNNG